MMKCFALNAAWASRPCLFAERHGRDAHATKDSHAISRILAIFGILLFVHTLAAQQTPPSSGPATQPAEIILFNGTDTSQWIYKDGSPCNWPIADGYMIASTANIETKEKYRNFKLHVEFWMPHSSDSTDRRKRSNSGVYLQGRYEIQLLDSYGLAPLTYQDNGGIYNNKPPDVNASLPAERWQTMDITFRAARWNDTKKIEPAKVSILLNDIPIHKDATIKSNSRAGDEESPEPAPIRLQFHGFAVRFRNIRITPMP